MADTKLSALTATTTLVDSDEFYVNDGGVSKKITKQYLDDNIDIALSQVNDVTSTATELNYNDGSSPGVAVASKTLVLGATKNVDTIDVAKDGLKIGGTAVTLTAAEANLLDGATFSTAEANYLTGTTSAIQTQLDAKLSSASPSAAQAWVNFNGSGTVAILDDYGVASITDNGTGQWTVNFDSAFSTANYAVTLGMYKSSGNESYFYASKGTTSVQIVMIKDTTVADYRDSSNVSMSAFSN